MIRDSSTMDRPAPRGGRLRRRLVLGAVAGIVALAGALSWPSVQRWAGSERSVDRDQIRIATVTRGDLVREVGVQGNVVAAHRPTLVSPARGVVTVEVVPGEVVETGDVMARVESPELESRVAQERSALRSLEADLARQRLLAEQSSLRSDQEIAVLEVELRAAERAVERAERIREEGLINEVEYERAVDDLEVATMRLAAAEKEAGFEEETLAFEVRDRESRLRRQTLVVEDLERRVDELAVRSPVAGLVARVEVADGDTVGEGEPIATVVDLSEFEVEVMVPEAYADEVTPGTPAVVRHDGREWEAAVQRVSPEVQGSRVRAVVTFSGRPPEGLRQNQRLPARLVLDTREDVLKVERGPFVEAGAGRSAYVVEDGLAVRRPVVVGSLSLSEVEIVEGLEEGDRIIVSDTGRLEGAERVLLRH